jgi:hypothetical protein
MVGWINKIIAIIIVVFLSLSLWGGKLFIIAISLIALYFIIRWLADLFYWGKDNNKW